MHKYQIKLTPVDSYFFGGEKHRKNNKNQLKADYFVESNAYPQQTTLLGMLRYYLYRSDKLIFSYLDDDKIEKRREAATNLIGKKSFSYNSNNQFGKINTISPLYFLHQNKAYHFAPFDLNFSYANSELKSTKKDKLYNAKEHYQPLNEQKITNSTDVKKLSCIITDVQHTGNKKAKPDETNLEGYYKMNKKKLANDWGFAFDAVIDLTDLDKETDYVTLGGEKSIFKIEFKKVNQFEEAEIPKQYKRDKPFLYLTADAFIKNDALNEVSFAINQFVSFRCMQSTTETANYNKLPKHYNESTGAKINKEVIIKEGLYRSCRYQLLKRGSVLYFDDMAARNQLESNLKTPEYKIGFNHYLKN